MKKEIVLEVINKLIGPINPVADSAIDSERLENLKLFIRVFDEMHYQISDLVARNKNTTYGSVKPFLESCERSTANIEEIE